jgi:hypothetical protein
MILTEVSHASSIWKYSILTRPLVEVMIQKIAPRGFVYLRLTAARGSLGFFLALDQLSVDVYVAVGVDDHDFWTICAVSIQHAVSSAKISYL